MRFKSCKLWCENSKWSQFRFLFSIWISTCIIILTFYVVILSFISQLWFTKAWFFSYVAEERWAVLYSVCEEQVSARSPSKQRPHTLFHSALSLRVIRWQLSRSCPLRPSPGHGGPWHTAEITSPPYKQTEPIKNLWNSNEPPPLSLSVYLLSSGSS